MHTAVVRLKSVSPYSQSRMHRTAKKDKESPDDYEKRTWRERLHVEAGKIFIPPMAFKNCLAEAAEFLSLKVAGKGQATWSKHFRAGVLVLEGLTLPDDPANVEGEWLNMHANGKRGSGTRVARCYPKISRWAGEVTFHILDDTITQETFAYHLAEAGKFIGIGRFRPRNGGFYGRFEVEKIKWT